MSAHMRLGEWGEGLAARFLEGQGFTLLDRRWRCRQGEIDIVARDGTTLVICEVKTRTTEAFGSPVAAVTPVKVRRLRRLAGAWLEAHDEAASDVRLDVIGILSDHGGRPLIEHLRGVG